MGPIPAAEGGRHPSAGPPPSGDLAVPGGLRRHLILSLVLAALVPLAAFGGLALLQVDAAVAAGLTSQVRVALDGASGLLERDRGDLEETTTSYATWPDLQAAVAAGTLADLEVDVVQFQVALGEFDVVAIASTTATVVGGDDGAADDIEEIARRAARAAPVVADVGPRQVGLRSGVYQVAAVPVVVDGRTVGSVAMARRLDAATVVAIARTTGFEVAVRSALADSPVATDAALAARVAAPPFQEADADVVIGDGLAVGRRALVDTTGARVGSLAVVKPLDALDAVASSLVALVAATLLLASFGAVLLAWALGVRLRRRAEAVAGWLDAVGAGRAPPTAVAADSDIRPVSRAVADLAIALHRREARLRASLDEVSRLNPRLEPHAVEEAGVRAAERVFELGEVTLEAAPPPSSRAHEATADALRSGPGPTVTAALEAVPPGSSGIAGDRPTAAPGDAPPAHDARILVGRGAAVGGWEEPDRAIFELYARLLGIAIRDAMLVDEAAHRAQALNRLALLQADFLRGVSHNLRQPLTTIRLAVDDLTGEADPSRIEVAAFTIRAESARLARLVNQLLTMSRLDAGTMRIEVEPIAPGALVRHVWSTLRSTRRFTIDDRAPGVLAVADRASVEQIMAILLDNAVAYAPRGPISVRIDPRRAGARAGDGDLAVDPRVAGSVAIIVSDTGPGVSADERELVFERFSRGSTSAGIDGTGLGLDVARGLARAMGGDVAYLARPAGAAFELLLPAEPDLGPA